MVLMENWTQIAFQYRDDDGSETGATDRQAVNVDDTLDLDTNYRMRVGVQGSHTGGSGSFDLTVSFQYRKNAAGGWQAITTTSSVCRAFGSAHFTDEDATTEQLAQSKTFVAGKMDDTGACAAVSISETEESEFEICFQLRSADLGAGDTVEIRILDSGSALNTYTQTPNITVALVGVTRAPPQGDLAITSDAPTVTVTENQFRAPSQADLAIDGKTPTVTVSQNVQRAPPQGDLAIDGKVPTVPGAPWKAALNTDIVDVELDTLCHIVFQLDHNGAVEANYVAQLEYNVGGAGWFDVTATSINIRATVSTRIADGTDVPQLLGSGTYLSTNAGYDDVNGAAGGADLDWSEDAMITEVNVQFGFVARSVDLSGGEVIELRIKGLEAYDHSVNLTIVAIGDNVSRAPAKTDLAITTAAPTLTVTANQFRDPPHADLAIDGKTPASLIAWSRAPAQTDLVISSDTPDIFIELYRVPPKADLAISTTAPTVDETHVKTVPRTDLVLSTEAPSQAVLQYRAPPQTNLVISSEAPRVDEAHVQSPPQADLVISATTPDLLIEMYRAPPRTNLVLDATAPTTVTALLRIAPHADLAISSTAPTVDEDHVQTVPQTDLNIRAKTPDAITAFLRSVAQADLAIEPKTPATLENIIRLIDQTDLVIETFRPRVDIGEAKARHSGLLRNVGKMMR